MTARRIETTRNQVHNNCQNMSIFRPGIGGAPGEDMSTSRTACGSRNSMPIATVCMTLRPTKSRRGTVPVAYAGAYDVGFDDVKYAWGADMSTDLVQRLNVDTGEWSGYLLPTSINTRHIDVQKSSDPEASPACGPKASSRARSSISSRSARNDPFAHRALPDSMESGSALLLS